MGRRPAEALLGRCSFSLPCSQTLFSGNVAWLSSSRAEHRCPCAPAAAPSFTFSLLFFNQAGITSCDLLFFFPPISSAKLC